MLIFIFLLLIILLSARNHIKYLRNKTLNLPDESQNILLTNINSHPLNINEQQESINQLLSILSQLILLIFLFLSSLSIYLHPLNSFKLPFQDIIYSHLYGFFVLFITFYILSFYVSSPYYFNRKSNQSYIQPPSSTTNSVINKEYDVPIVVEESPPSNSHYASTICVYEVPPNAEKTSINDNASLKRLKNVTSDFYACHSDMPKSNEIIPVSSLDMSSQE